MSLSVMAFIQSIFKPAVDLVDELHTSDEEQGNLDIKLKKLENALVVIQNEMAGKYLEYEKQLMIEKSSIIKAETQGHSWMQRNWRPVLMLTIVAIVANNYLLFPYISMFTDKAVMLELPKALWNLMTMGVGGYIVGRSGENIVKNLPGNKGGS